QGDVDGGSGRVQIQGPLHALREDEADRPRRPRHRRRPGMFLIDGYNLLHSFARAKSGDEARSGLIALIQAWSERGGYRARIVFDPTGGMKRNEVRGAIEIRNVPQ